MCCWCGGSILKRASYIIVIFYIMSFNKNKKIIEEGDTVMLYLGRQSLMAIKIDTSKTHQTKFGAFPHQDMIGKSFGAKAYSKNRKGWVYLLHPTPELWTVTLPHRTQILYSTDISMITLQLELKPGSIVIESGTGSGSLSHAIIRTVKPNGHLHTFDFHEQRVEKAKEEFEDHGIGDFVTCSCADACADGFGLKDKADAVFLDLPAPWDAIPHAKQSLKKSGGRLCSFSPCIEQVQRTCDVLRQLRFCDINVVECLLRSVNVQTISFLEANLGSIQTEGLTTKRLRTDQDCSDAKRIKTNSEENSADKAVSTASDTEELKTIRSNTVTIKKPVNTNMRTLKSSKEMPGHTGYLTFASLYPELS